MRFMATGFLTLALVLLSAGASHARTWYVTEDGMGDAPTIQAAMDSAAYGDTVLVGPGAYEGSMGVVIFSDGVSLISEMGPQHTVLRSDWGNLVTMYNVTFARLEGFTLEGATAATWNEHSIWCGGNDWVPNREILICNNIMLGGNIDYGIHGIYFDGEIWGNVIVGHRFYGVYMEFECQGTVHNNIIIENNIGVNINESYTPVYCNDLWGNATDYYVPPIGEPWDPPDSRGNFSEDPLFCDRDNGDYTLNSCSPCLPGNHPAGFDCGLIGTFGLGCGPTSVETESWSQVKELFK